MDTFTSIFTKKFMIWLFSRVRHYLTITLRNPADKRGFFYLNNDFFTLLIKFNSSLFVQTLLNSRVHILFLRGQFTFINI
ncbi:hypothetical protein BK761_29535 [Bacillus thuringiensis serovar darmstadiensis]|uniref:Uncharacterized protein n=1 Tax=Bacillus thuringiensis subsp. darmstadiensis TaxID=132264 RepID=A0A9X6IQ60_BACUD|nr:hypothetical protein BK761_29535 [Bacillus thuringiensis serovar darmstadiensis]